jgi:hypothetical protein
MPTQGFGRFASSTLGFAAPRFQRFSGFAAPCFQRFSLPLFNSFF